MQPNSPQTNLFCVLSCLLLCFPIDNSLQSFDSLFKSWFFELATTRQYLKHFHYGLFDFLPESCLYFGVAVVFFVFKTRLPYLQIVRPILVYFLDFSYTVGLAD